MPHRVEPYPMSTAQYPYPPPAPSSGKPMTHHGYDRHASPPAPPIATLPTPAPTHSGSPSPSASSHDRSAVSTPSRRSPPPTAQHPHQGYPPPPPGYMYAPPPQHAYAPPNVHTDTRYAQTGHPPPGYPYAYAPYPTVIAAPHHAPPSNGAPQAGVQIIHTDDAATKLSDRVRRRCFNCCTTDTSTWRRSNLSPGKVLCNKCGLFERTHSRARPEQFPHKRGPLATSNLTRSPPRAAPYPPPSQTNSSTSSSSAPHATTAPPASRTPNPPETTPPKQNVNGAGSHPPTPKLPAVESWAPKDSDGGRD
ncbi:hypothetical protein FB45DRAFT_906128 [Roridomyces roridus]|uniref:GATA-type domain-containing protein n=1 Tax=Roridomyces roridus TaxID=1738132 RepID=A0AAD7C0Y8_9AGAR|nr:hypothetical protein FB45DRAFT_906128 [Roridomyces roridus]